MLGYSGLLTTGLSEHTSASGHPPSCPLNSRAGFHTRDCHGAGLGCGLGGRSWKTGWFQAQPEVRILAMSPHSFNLGARFSEACCEKLLCFLTVLFCSWPLLSLFLLSGPTNILSEPNAGLLFPGYLQWPSCFLGTYGVPSMVFYRI